MRATLVLTHACNLACGYCYMGEHHAGAMSEEVALRAVDLLFAATDRAAIGFFGGEPLLAWERLVAIVRRAEANASAPGKSLQELQLTTNATLLTDERALFLRDHHVRMAVSLDGDRGVHDAGRPQKGGASSFEAVMRGVEALRRAGHPFDVIAVTTPENCRALAASVAFLDGIGARRIVLSPAFERTWSDEDLAAWELELERVGDHYTRAFRERGEGKIASLETKIIAALDGARASECSVGRWSVAVAPSGNLYPCERLVGEDRDTTFVVGHLDDGILPPRSIGRGPKAAECGPCPERYRCGSSCACANVAETGDPSLPGGVQCWYEQVVARVADRCAEALLDDPRFVELAYPAGITSRQEVGRVEASIPRRRHLPMKG